MVARRIEEVLSLPLRAGELHLSVRASIGIAIAPAGSTFHDLLRDADIAMYEAKASPRTPFTVFDPSMRTTARDRISLRSDLERAVEREELHLVYQPIVELSTGRTTSTEALLRWSHPERGPVSPAEFIPMAEQSGQITTIGRWVLEQSCRDAAGWVRRGQPVGVSVNASALQLDDFAGQVQRAVASAGLPPHLLTLEITETAMMNDPESMSTVLTQLRSLGIKVAVDDFGTGSAPSPT
ncbi:hypothetical protein BH18ACT1_BH18ACT1_02400 [soil metagenome]